MPASAGAPAVPDGGRHPAGLHRLPREVAGGLGGRARAAGRACSRWARRGLRGPDRRREAAARAARGDRAGQGADRHPDLGRRRAIAAGGQVLQRPRQARRVRRHGSRGGVRPLRARADAPHPRDRAEDRRAAGRARPTRRSASSSRPTRRCWPSASAATRRASSSGARTSRTTRRSRPSAARPSRAPTSARSTPTSSRTPSSRTILRRSGASWPRACGKRAQGPHDRDQGAPRRLDHGHARQDAGGPTNDTQTVIDVGARAAARLRAAAAGAPARRPRGRLRGRRARPSTGARRAGGPARAAALDPDRRGRELAARLARQRVLDAELVQDADDGPAQRPRGARRRWSRRSRRSGRRGRARVAGVERGEGGGERPGRPPAAARGEPVGREGAGDVGQQLERRVALAAVAQDARERRRRRRRARARARAPGAGCASPPAATSAVGLRGERARRGSARPVAADARR